MDIDVGAVIALGLIALIIGGAVAYIIKAKKKGVKCIGCPQGCSCSAKNGKKADGEENVCCACHKE